MQYAYNLTCLLEVLQFCLNSAWTPWIPSNKKTGMSTERTRKRSASQCSGAINKVPHKIPNQNKWNGEHWNQVNGSCWQNKALSSLFRFYVTIVAVSTFATCIIISFPGTTEYSCVIMIIVPLLTRLLTSYSIAG